MRKRKKDNNCSELLKKIIDNPLKNNLALKQLVKQFSSEKALTDFQKLLYSNISRCEMDYLAYRDSMEKKNIITVVYLIREAYYKKQVKARRKFKALITITTFFSLGLTWPLTYKIYKNVKEAEPVQRRSAKKMRNVLLHRPELALSSHSKIKDELFNHRGEFRKSIREKQINPEKYVIVGTDAEQKAQKIKYAYMSQEQAEINDTLYKFFKKSERKQEKHTGRIKEKIELIKARSQKR